MTKRLLTGSKIYPLYITVVDNSGYDAGYDVEWIVIDPPKEELRKRIDLYTAELDRVAQEGRAVRDKKIASVGLRLKKECCYHGISLNVDMDLAPFSAIDPCGYRGLEVTQLRDLGIYLSQAEAAEKLLKYLTKELGYSD